jgi:site-specific recombinase XerC
MLRGESRRWRPAAARFWPSRPRKVSTPFWAPQRAGHLLAQVERLAKNGERDYVLLSVLYDTGARIQELLDLTPRNFHLETPPFVRVRGKGRRERLCPLLPQSASLIRTFLSAHGRRFDEQEPLLQNRQGTRLTRHGAPIHLAQVPTSGGKLNAHPNACTNQPAYHETHEGNAFAAVWRAPRHGQRLPWACGLEVHRSLRPGGSRDEAQGPRPD